MGITLSQIAVPAIAVLIVVGMALHHSGFFSKRPRKRSKTEEGTDHSSEPESHETEAVHTPPPATPAGGSAHGAHGNDHGHGGKKIPGWLNLLLWGGAICILILLARLVLPSPDEIPRVRDTSVAATSTAPTPLRPVQEEWEPVLLHPTGSQWIKVPTLPGRTIQYCRTDTDPNCTDTEPKGFRVQCKDSSGEVRTWPNICVIGDWIAWQSSSDERVPLKWRDKPR